MTLDNPDLEKSLRSILNKVTEGNVDPMFYSHIQPLSQTYRAPTLVPQFAHAFTKLFIQFNITHNQQMSTALLSVNCAFLAALHRSLGDKFLALCLW
jgi:hypothetical protein